MKIKQEFYNLSILLRINFILILLLMILIPLILNSIKNLQTKLSSSYFILFEEFCKLIIFLLYKIFVIMGTKINFNKLELRRIETLINIHDKYNRKFKLRELNYRSLAILRTFVFYSPLYYSFVWFPFILSLLFPLFNSSIHIYEILKFSTINVIKANLIVLIGIKFLTNFNTILIYLYIGSSRSFLYILSYLICCLYRFFMLYLTGIPEFDALYMTIFIFNLLFSLILFYISIQKNIRSNVYVE